MKCKTSNRCLLASLIFVGLTVTLVSTSFLPKRIFSYVPFRPPSIPAQGFLFHVNDSTIRGHFARNPDDRAERSGQRLLVALHGCNCRSDDWFTLPEEMSVVRRVFNKRLFSTVLAVDSTDQEYHCWITDPDDDTDVENIRMAMTAASGTVCGTPDHEKCFPGGIVVIGSSSGGTMATKLVPILPDVVGAVVIVSPGDEYSLNQFVEMGRPPRMAFVHMKGDKEFASETVINRTVDFIESRFTGKARSYLCTDTHLNASTFSARVPGFTEQASKTLWDALVYKGFVDKEKNEVTIPLDWDPVGDVASIVARCEKELSNFPWSAFEKSIRQELSVLMNYHEMTREHVIEALEWVVDRKKGLKRIDFDL